MTYPAADLPLGTLPWVHWSVNSVAIDDPQPIPVNGALEIPTDGALFIRQLLALIGSRLLGTTSGLPAGPWVSDSAGGSTPRVSLSFDGNGDITSATLTPPA